jgi:hypothetical protein
VKLHSGRNVVEFRFRAPWRRAAGVIIAIVSLIGIVVLGAGTVGALR